MVYGLDEEANDDFERKVGAVFQELGEKPHLEAVRLGQQATDKIR